MFEFESKHFILAFGVMLLLSGAIIFYFQNRVGSLEKAIGKQNQVLSSFIANVQSELRGAGPPMVQAPQSAPGPPDVDYGVRSVPNDKIEVSSDDYDSDSDSDSSNTSNTSRLCVEGGPKLKGRDTSQQYPSTMVPKSSSQGSPGSSFRLPHLHHRSV